MTSIKCRNCGLVNFATEQSCKRCNSALPHASTGSDQFASFNSPPPPPTFHGGAEQTNSSSNEFIPPCIKCGSRKKITVRNFVKIYHSPVVLLSIFIGLLPYFILKRLLRTKHDLTGPFCEPCWQRFQSVKWYNAANILLFLVLLISGIAFSIYIDSVSSEWWLLGSLVVSLVVFTAGNYYLETFGPKYRKVNAKEVVIDAPFVGAIVYSK